MKTTKNLKRTLMALGMMAISTVVFAQAKWNRTPIDEWPDGSAIIALQPTEFLKILYGGVVENYGHNYFYNDALTKANISSVTGTPSQKEVKIKEIEEHRLSKNPAMAAIVKKILAANPLPTETHTGDTLYFVDYEDPETKKIYSFLYFIGFDNVEYAFYIEYK
jgi:hypothetical protein